MQPKAPHPQFEEPFTEAGQYRYRMRNTGHSSTKFGPCEICGNHVAEVFYQVEGTCYAEDDGSLYPTYAGCRSLFGHETCLKNARRN